MIDQDDWDDWDDGEDVSGCSEFKKSGKLTMDSWQ